MIIFQYDADLISDGHKVSKILIGFKDHPAIIYVFESENYIEYEKKYQLPAIPADEVKNER